MSTLTIGALHRMLDKLVQQGHARKPVCVDKATFWGPLESDGITIFDATEGEFLPIPQGDDDGGTRVNKDGSESMRRCLVLRGGHVASEFDDPRPCRCKGPPQENSQ